MSWGIRIAIVYVGFVALIVGMVIVSANSKSELVAKDYYAQELRYQEKIDAMAHEKALTESVNYTIGNNEVQFTFPVKEMAKDFSGEIFFFRPSDSTKDKKIKMNFGSNGTQSISKSSLSKGVYKLCISWKNNNTTYYKEQIVNI